jgi:hypothetical protein
MRRAAPQINSVDKIFYNTLILLACRAVPANRQHTLHLCRISWHSRNSEQIVAH